MSDKQQVRPWHCILLATLSALLAGDLSRAGFAHRPILFESHGLLLSQSGESCQPVADAAHYEKVIRPSGCCYVVLQSDEGESWLTLLQCNAAGELGRVRRISGGKARVATAILSATPENRGDLSILVHISPEEDATLCVALDE